MNDISCDICMDLIPLVKDGAASQDSQKAVAAHTAHCANCRALLPQVSPPPQMHDGHVLRGLRQRLAMGALILIFAGAFLGVGLSDSQAVFYNILIMPAIGALGYVALRKKAFLTPVGLFALSYLVPLFQLFIRGEGGENAADGLFFWALIYCGLCALGTLIAALLHFAFRKDGSSYEP